MKHDSENDETPPDQREADEVTSEESEPVESQNTNSTEQDDDVDGCSDHMDPEQSFSDLTRSQLIDRLFEANSRISEMKDGYIRAKADVENIRRRSHNETVSARKYAIEGFARELLSVVDSLDQASKVEIDPEAGETAVKMKEGLELTLRQMDTVMEKFGVSHVEADSGVRFDPEFHQAIAMIDSDDVESGHIVTVMQKGFVLKDRLLRPAMVVIAN